MARTSKNKVLTIIWRDENYGRINDATAFRAELEPFPSDSEGRKLARIYKKSGYEFNENRYSWIAEYKSKDTPLLLIDALRDAGYEIVNRGAQPDVLHEAKINTEIESANELKM
jgi:phosphopentomutase